MNLNGTIKELENQLIELKKVRKNRLSKKPYKERYHQRIKDFLINVGDNTRNSFKIIELRNVYITDTVSVLFPKELHPVGWSITPQTMIDNNVIIKQLLHVKNGIIVSYHFTD